MFLLLHRGLGGLSGAAIRTGYFYIIFGLFSGYFRDFFVIFGENRYIHKLMKKSTFFAVAAMAVFAMAETARGQGNLSGSFETNSIWYVPDRVPAPADRFGSNNYLKLDYAEGNFVAGAQYELYSPVLQGFNPNLAGNKVTGKFAGWSDGGFAITVGDFYEQLGNGLIFRSYEDRALGFNNSTEGVRAAYASGPVALKFIYGRPRLFMDYADTQVRGADASLSLTSLLGMESHYIALEGSYVNRFMGNAVLPAGRNLNIYSGRFVFDADFGFSARGEYVAKGKDLYMEEEWKAIGGGAQLVELSYNNSGLGIIVTGRRLDHMGVRLDPDDLSVNNTLNYLPSLTRQYTYSLAMLDPYQTDAVEGEQGGQVDVFYTFARGSALGGKYGTRVHANASTFYPLEKRGVKMNALYRDISFDVEKQWNKELKTTLLYAVQTFSPSKAVSTTTEVANVFVADMLYKFTPRNSVRMELQYLYSKERSDWWAAMAEFSMAPRWSFFAGDMFDFEEEKVHYYSAGVSYTRSRTRLAVSYGRNRKGQVCSGGVCREMPEYTGGNISLTTSF
jgi:hypothetical protein